jgi:UDP-N-acetylglucosamine diphosphorylase / glucose-1-phosphate thymidylyltransferase / UDP-N-acetylgalactosamine diphosphorylase / glucosamine-1-phosphate N-acetyltransferase / galactosamine-1-phosphate N-acetyltransferase
MACHWNCMKNNMQNSTYLANFLKHFPGMDAIPPWEMIATLSDLLNGIISTADSDYVITDRMAIHRTATVEQHVVIKGPAVIGAGVFVGAHAYLRGGVFLGEKVSVGPGCEIKSSIILDHSALAHFNFIGDSLLGSGVNMEAGSILANYHNDRDDKTIYMQIAGERIRLPINKFGSFIGDGVKIGANAVCSPGTFLEPGKIVKRLQLIEQT